MNTKQQGDIGVAMAIAYYTSQGHVVSVPLTDNARYDLLVEIDEEFVRVQCKCTGYSSPYGSFIVSLRTNGGNRSGQTVKKISKDECDQLFVHVLAGDNYIFFPDEFDDKSTLVLHSGYDKNKVAIG
jgi:hypothetical protein